MAEFELSPGPPPLTVAAYVPGAKVNTKLTEVYISLLPRVPNIKIQEIS